MRGDPVPGPQELRRRRQPGRLPRLPTPGRPGRHPARLVRLRQRQLLGELRSEAHVTEITDYLGRQQHLLRQGRPQLDGAIYRNSYCDYGKPGRTLAGKPKYYNDPGLEQEGFSYEFLSPTLLALPNATVRQGRLEPSGPAYKAVVIDQQKDMPVRTARKVVSLARAGLPVVVVGEAPARTPFYGDAEVGDAQVQAAMATLLGLPDVVAVSDDSEVTSALAELGVEAAAQPSTPALIHNVHRVEGKTDYYYYYWLYSPGARAITLTISFEGQGRPYVLDGWSGQIEPVAEYRTPEGWVLTEVTLAPGETTTVALTAFNNRFGVKPAGHGVNSTDLDVGYAHGDLLARGTSAGQEKVELHNSRTAKVTVPEVHTAQTLDSWHLAVDDWQPRNAPAQTIKVTHERDLTTLKPWSELPSLEDVSGVGTYTRTVDLPHTWSGRNGAYLDLGRVFDTVVRINGHELPGVDLTNPRVRIDDHLRPGPNSIEVEVATTLRNRMRTLAGSGHATRPASPTDWSYRSCYRRTWRCPSAEPAATQQGRSGRDRPCLAQWRELHRRVRTGRHRSGPTRCAAKQLFKATLSD